MDNSNQTSVRTFILLGLSSDPILQPVFFLLLLLMYVVTVSGNLILIVVVGHNSRLQNAMYFFLSNLSIIDICFSTSVVPMILQNTISKDRSISLFGCATQMFFHLSLGATEGLILSAMAFDRYNAICKPLRYTTVMTTKMCLCLSATCWTLSFFAAFIHIFFAFRLPYCKSNSLDHFFCELPPLLRLSCKDPWVIKVSLQISGGIFGFLGFLSTCLSYVIILCTIFRTHSTRGRYKAFHTCASHLTVVALYYCPIIFTYLRPLSNFSPVREQALSILYSVVTPMLNPIIYSVRNKDIKETLQKAIRND